MTVLPLRLAYSSKFDEWRIEDATGLMEAGGYRTKSEAEEDKRGLERFYGDHPDYLELPSCERDEKMSEETNVVVQVTKDEAVAMFTALGMKTSSTWNKQRMTEKISKLRDAHEKDHAFEDEAAAATFAKIWDALESGAAIELVKGEGSAADDSESEGKPAKEPKQPKPAKEPKKTRLFCAGEVIARHGVEIQLTDEIADEVCAVYGNVNRRESKWALGLALNGIKGYLSVKG